MRALKLWLFLGFHLTEAKQAGGQYYNLPKVSDRPACRIRDRANEIS